MTTALSPRKFLTGMSSGLMGVAVRSVANLVVIPTLIAGLGQAGFGFYMLLISVVDLIQMMDLGFSSGIIKLLGSYRALQNEQQVEDLLSHSHGFFAAIGLLVGLLGTLLSSVFAGLLNDVPPDMLHLAQIGFAIAAVDGALSLYGSYFKAILVAHGQVARINLADIFFSIFVLVAVLTLLGIGQGLVALLAARLVGGMIRLGMLMTRAVEVEPKCIRPWRFRQGRKTLKELLDLSGYSMISSVSIIISHRIDGIVIATFLPIASVGIYDIVFRMLQPAAQIFIRLRESYMAYFIRLSAAGDLQGLQTWFLRISSFLNVVAVILMVLFVGYYHPLFNILSAGRIPYDLTLPILAVAVPITLTGAIQMPASAFLFIGGRHRWLAVSSVVTAAINFTVSVIFVQNLGLLGVALGTLIPQGLQHQLFLIPEACRELRIGFWTYFRSVHVTAWPSLLLVAALVWLGQPLLKVGPTPVIGILAVSLVAGALGLVVWFALTATPAERAFAKNKVLPRLSRVFRGGRSKETISSQRLEGAQGV
jgi:O-antigen/teichoic acid export membrane protein